MIRKVRTFAASLLIGLAAAAAVAADSQPQLNIESYAASYELAQLTASIRGASDVHKVARESRSNALRHLSQPAQKRFLDSLTFTERGVSGFSFEDIERELTATEAFEVLTMIGQQQFVPQMQGLRAESELDNMLMRGAVPGAQTKCLLPEFPIINSEQAADCGPLVGYRCIARATCGESMRNACTSNC